MLFGQLFHIAHADSRSGRDGALLHRGAGHGRRRSAADRLPRRVAETRAAGRRRDDPPLRGRRGARARRLAAEGHGGDRPCLRRVPGLQRVPRARSSSFGLHWRENLVPATPLWQLFVYDPNGVQLELTFHAAAESEPAPVIAPDRGATRRANAGSGPSCTDSSARVERAPPMKISRVEAVWLQVPIPEDQQHMSDFGRAQPPSTPRWCAIETDAGLTGWGEAKVSAGSIGDYTAWST